MDNDTTAPSPARPSEPLPQGTSVAGRFRIESLAGRGGMGSVYRAQDSTSGRLVALKLLNAVTTPEVAYRFNREAVLLSGLRHPGIVSYVAHGTTDAGQPFLAMEWLEGEDLARRLERQPLGLPETLTLLHRAAEALSTAHRQGIVHRDLKPSNLFLRGGRPEDVVLLDFGLARHVAGSRVAVTGTGMVVGTPGYMAPEQASGELEIPPAADIFSLGCVLYECLTGQTPFKAPHFAAALAKILFAEPAPLNALRPGLRPGLQVLVDRMLTKDPRRRIPDAPRLLEVLGALESGLELARSQEQALPPGLAGTEQQLISILLISPHATAAGERNKDPAWRLALRDSLKTMLAPHGARVELLADGSLVATLVSERGTATDQAAMAARCALTVKEHWPDVMVVLTTGLGAFDKHLPVGGALDRAGRLLHQFERTAPSSALVLDDVTAGLLGPDFQLSRVDSASFLLRGEQMAADASRPLLGRPTPCVGREQELALLDLTFTACVEESAARAVLVTAPAGVGKSRLRHEFLRRIEKREQPPLVLLGRGDPITTGASYGLLGQALRRLCGVEQGESLEAWRTRLHQRVALRLPEPESREVVEFLGEVCAVPFPEENSPRLKAARNDPRLMGTQTARALVTFLKAECAHQPVLLVLEDLHWSDALTVTLVGGLLRELAEQPFLVLALARPEVKETFPQLWSRYLQEVTLKGLSRKAGARLVREVLGAQVPEAIVQRAVEMSDGNALFLEELIRTMSEGRGEAVPETVLAVLQARLMRMEPGVRQVLLAASIFGRTFLMGGVRALLGGHTGEQDLERQLRRLVEEEILDPQPSSGISGVSEYRFRHALVRDAAYSLVPDEYRPVGHRLAGEWLEAMGGSDALALAMHYHMGQQLERAVGWYTRAAEQLFERQDLHGTMRCVEEALWCAVDSPALAKLRALQAMVAFWMDEWPRSVEFGGPVLEGLKAGSPLWCRVLGGLILGSANEGHSEEMTRLGELLLKATPEPEALAAYVEAIALLCAAVIWSGERQTVEVLVQRALEVGAREPIQDVMAYAWTRSVWCQFLFNYEARPWQAFLAAEEAPRKFREIGSDWNAILMQCLLGLTLHALGDVTGAVALTRECLTIARHTEQQLIVTYAQSNLMTFLATSTERADREEARALALEWVAGDSARSYKPGVASSILAHTFAADGELDEAESHARRACAQLVPFRSYLSFARQILSSVLLARGKATEAREVAELGVRDLERMGSEGAYTVGMRLALAEACFAQGDASTGEAALRKALQCVRARASDIPEPAARERFLRQVPENARTLELAHQRWGETAA